MSQGHFKNAIGSISIGCLAVVSCLLPFDKAQAVTLHTTDFIPDITRTNFNGFEGLPSTVSYNGISGYVEGGVKVEQVNGRPNGIWTTFLPPGLQGNRAWHPNGGDYGYTKITRADGSDFVNVGLLRSHGWADPNTYVYQLLKNGVSIFSGTLFGDSHFGEYLGFSGGGFNEIRLGNYSGHNPGQTLSGLNGLVIDSIELSGSAQPIPTPALLPGLIGLGVSVLKQRKLQAIAVSGEQEV